MDSFALLLKELFAHNPALTNLRQQIQQQRLQAWLAGGCLRDLLLNRPPDDFDVTTAEDPSSLAQNWAQQSGGHWFWLDADRLQSRVVLPNRLMVDFSPLRAATIVGDLNLRDFTINALAVSLTGDFTTCQLVDPLNGQKDLADNLLSFCSSHSIPDDPLRMLKGIRHAATLRFDLSDQARMQIESEAASLTCVAGERIRDELGKILNSELPGYGIELLYQAGLLQPLFGQPADSWKPLESIAEIRKLDLLIKENTLHCTGQQDELFGTHALFLLATFLRGYSNGGLESLLHEGLRLSRRQQRLIICLQNEPAQTWYDHVSLVSTVRQKALLAEQLGAFPVEQLRYWALVGQKLSLDQAGELIAAFRQLQKQERIPDLVDGHQLGDLLQLSGKQTGAWLQRIKQAEIDGEISSSEDVPAWLQGKISD